ncbi:MAG TPA: SIMPL domain-containing protein [Verrucomicrobiae bacterium]|nr:SIMPL domain-containing protein [Verrucomicrobiae bacterium]
MKCNSILLLVLALTGFDASAEEPKLPQIVVFGTAVTEVVPDEMHWTVEIRNRNTNLERAAADHAKSVGSVLGLLKDLKLDQKNIQTSRMQFGDHQEYVGGSYVKSGYYARTEVSFKLTEFNLYTNLWIELARIPGVSVESTAYDSSKKISHRNEARQKALRAAKEKATEMVRVLGTEIGEPLFIEELSLNESGYDNAINNLRVVEEGDTEDRGSLSLGTIPVRAKVKVSFRLITVHK